ncbi:HEPN domain-containing protein [Herpetosiphon gulosus]|uniref:ApeA N-terminal domain-containing protein n=1 Tax=Herpetosiphon gulosus TaxID=1973496 RepID=A0ABP9X861_9CHLR
MKNFNCLGWWWIPSQEENKVAGELRFLAEKGFFLDLVGSFENGIDPIFTRGHVTYYPVIFGITTEGKQITLVHCNVRKLRISSGVENIQLLRVNYAYKNIHIINPDEYTFQKVTLRFRNLNQWAILKGFILKISTENQKFNKYEALYENINNIDIELDNIKMSFVYGINYKIPYKGFIQKINAEEDVLISIKLSNDENFYSIINNYINPIQDLITFASCNAISIESINLFSDKHKRILKPMINSYMENNEIDLEEEDYLLPINIMFKQRYIDNSDIGDVIDKYLFSLDDIKDDYSNIIRRWFLINNELAACIQLLLRNRYMRLEDYLINFINITQMLEIYHRIRIGGGAIPNNIFRKHVRSIVQMLRPNKGKWVKERLKNSNNPTLKKRIEDLLHKNSYIMSDLIEDFDIFSQKVAKNRNYYTHYSKQDNTIWNSTELSVVCDITTILSYSCILEELGINTEQRLKMLRKHSSYENAKRNIHMLD